MEWNRDEVRNLRGMESVEANNMLLKLFLTQLLEEIRELFELRRHVECSIRFSANARTMPEEVERPRRGGLCETIEDLWIHFSEESSSEYKTQQK
jgi:hypothetical protein